MNLCVFFLLQFCPYADDNDDAEISADQVVHECQYFLVNNMNWALTDMSVGGGPLTFIYTAVKSSDGKDKFGAITVNVSLFELKLVIHINAIFITVLKNS